MKENNELIAEFMGIVFWKQINGEKYYKVPKEHVYANNAGLGQFRYHTSWDWLMPVVEKIASLMPPINIPEDLEALKNGTHGSDPYIDVISMSISSPINEIYEAVVKFITWYNTTKQQSLSENKSESNSPDNEVNKPIKPE